MNFRRKDLICLIFYKINSRLKFFAANKASGLSQLDANAKSAKISNCHHYADSGEIEFITNNDDIYRILKRTNSICGEVFSCPCCKVVHIGIKYENAFLGFSLCELCTNAMDCVSTVPFVIINAKTGERHRFELRLLK